MSPAVSPVSSSARPGEPASLTATEIASQPACWRRAADLLPRYAPALPRKGETVAVIGCGTSWYIAQAYAHLREQGGHGTTDAFAASEYPRNRTYDRILALTRSGTTTEVLDLLHHTTPTTPTTAITADPTTPVMHAATTTAVLDFADEQSVVQTRFATTTLALLRAHLETEHHLPTHVRPLTHAITDAETALTTPLHPHLTTARQHTFLGTGWTHGLALEAALKMREAAGAWTEAYPAMEYRHGPISIAQPHRAVIAFGPLPDGLHHDITRTGATLTAHSQPHGIDPLADLVHAQRLAVHLAHTHGHNPDAPRNLTRSVVLPQHD